MLWTAPPTGIQVPHCGDYLRTVNVAYWHEADMSKAEPDFR
jgi:hypothetical protein